MRKTPRATGRLITAEPEPKHVPAPKRVRRSLISRWFDNALTQSLTPVSDRWLLDHVYREGKGGFQR